MADINLTDNKLSENPSDVDTILEDELEEEEKVELANVSFPMDEEPEYDDQGGDGYEEEFMDAKEGENEEFLDAQDDANSKEKAASNEAPDMKNMQRRGTLSVREEEESNEEEESGFMPRTTSEGGASNGGFRRNVSQTSMGRYGFPGGEDDDDFINNQQMTSIPSTFTIGRPESIAGSIKDEPLGRRASIISATFSEPDIEALTHGMDDDAVSLAPTELTLTKTINNVDDFTPENPPEVGTVLEEETPKPVQLMVEFLGSDVPQSGATRDYMDALYNEPRELSIECQFLPKIYVFSNTDPFCVLYIRDNSRAEWNELGSTEKLTNCHFPRFVTKFHISAQPDLDMDKEILVKVFGKGSMKKSVSLGHAICALWDVVTAPGQCKVMKMESINPNKDTWIILSGDIARHDGAERPVTIHLKFDKTAKPRNKTFFMLNRSLKKARWTPIYRSEGHANPNREFEPAVVSYADLFCASDKKPMRLEFFQKRTGIDPKLVGFVQVSMKQLQNMDEGRVLQWWSGQDGIAPGVVVLAKKVITDEEISIWLSVTNE